MPLKVEAVTQSGNIKAAVEAFPARLRCTHPQHTAAAAALQTGSTRPPLSPDDGDSRPVSPVCRGLDRAHIKERGQEARRRRRRKCVCRAVCPQV